MLVSKSLELPGIFHGFFTREGGVSTGIYKSLNTGLGSADDKDKVLENRRRIAAKAGVDPDFLLSPHQVHSPDVRTVSAPWQADDDRKADALVTNDPNVAIGVLSADCGPVLFADPGAKVIGAAHSGWKGAVTGVLDNTILEMEKLGASRDNIIAVLGPTISIDAYEVGPEFKLRFTDQNSDNSKFFIASNKPEHFYFDLPKFILSTLKKAGVGRSEWTGHCTYHNEDTFFSYRRTTHRQEEDYGRQMSVIRLNGMIS
ncbi:MAG: peptidoglycan editing factor PgeF [Rhodobacteraceae bacterium]|nr:peptidoglycan editing factor PgeF [Paracoccaceae bacterium]